MGTKLEQMYSVALRLANATFDGFDSWFETKAESYTADFVKNPTLSRFNHGIAITGAKAGPLKLAYQNTAVFGATGSGKSSTVIHSSVVSLARGKTSMVFNDVMGEAYNTLSGFLAREGYMIRKINFRNPLESESFNPLEFIKSDTGIFLVAYLMYVNSDAENKGDKFWEHSSVMLLSLIIRYLYHHADRKYLSIQNVLRIVERLSYDPSSVSKLFVRTHDEELINSYKATVAMSEKTLQSIIATLRTILRLWLDKTICQTTATSSFSLDELRGEQPVAIFVCTEIQDLNYTKPITALFYHTLFNYTLSRIPDENERSIIFILDEFAIYTFPEVATLTSTIRKFKAGLLIAMQDEAALTARYGASVAHQIITNMGTQIYLKGQPLDTCKKLSQILGKHTFETDRGEKSRELLTPDEIRMLEDAIILINNKPPMKAKMVPHFENIWLRHLTKLPPYVPEPIQMKTPELIPFE